jgi:sulfotransferase family protein
MLISGLRSYYPNVSDRRYAFAFVCQQGRLETAALLLAASLKRFLRVEHELIAAVPIPAATWGEPTPVARELLEEMGVRVETFTNEFGRSRATANKIWCLRVPTDADKLVFLDSDMLCLREFGDQERFAIPINVAPAYIRTFSGDAELWEAAYRAAGVEKPAMRQPTLATKEFDLPYFSSGIVAVNNDVPLGEVWLDCVRALAADESVPNPRFEDQMSLPIAIQKLGVAYDCLDERYNYHSRARRIDDDSRPFFCHYGHRPMVQYEPVLEATVRSLVEERPELIDVMNADEHWSTLGRHFADGRGASNKRGRTQAAANANPQQSASTARRERPEPPDLLVTGIASSGVGYLSGLLDSYSNCVVITETGSPRVESGLRAQLPLPVAAFYAVERARILDAANLVPPEEGIPGRPASGDMQSEPARAETDDFVFATTSTHRYLDRLDGLLRVLPHARFVVCVRDPLDTIASWKRCMEGRPLQEALDSPLVPKPGDPWLTAFQQKDVSLMRDAAGRGAGGFARARAMLWQHFAELILDQLDRVLLVRYDDLVDDPEGVVEQVLGGLNPGTPANPISAAKPGDRSNLDAEDAQAIRAICSQAAFELGL